MKIYSFFLLFCIFTSCQTAESQSSSPTITVNTPQPEPKFINSNGKTIQTRFLAPAGFTPVISPKNSYASYLQNLPLHPHGAKVHYYNGAEKYNHVYEAVINIDVGKRDLQQCADAIMRLRAEYFVCAKRLQKYSFRLQKNSRQNCSFHLRNLYSSFYLINCYLNFYLNF